MSIQSEISRISTNVRNSLQAVADAGIEIPEDANSDNIESLIRQIGPADSVRYSAQTPTDAQKVQARKNINAFEMPEIVDSSSECNNENKTYLLPDGNVYEITTREVDYWENAVSSAKDLKGAGVFTNGYADNYYVSDVNQTKENGCVATAFIPYVKKSDGSFPTIYIKGLAWKTTNSRWRCYVYTSTPTVIYGSSNILNMIGTNANLWTNFTVQNYTNGQWVDVASQTGTGTYWRLVPKAALSTNTSSQTVAYLRMSFGANSEGTGKDLIISIDNPIESTTEYGLFKTGYRFVPADYDDKIAELERRLTALGG